MFIKQTLLHGLIIITSMMYTDILVVHAKIKRKKFFLILPSHPHTYPGKSLFIGISSVRVSVRGGEGKCEGYSIAFSSFSTYSLTSIPNSFLKHCEKYRGVEKPTR